jgi:regulator of sigma E protease
MVEFLISLIAFVVAIAILVAVHEWGHFIVARGLGIKVLRFSIGFGRPILTKKSGPDQTEYCLSAIPVGGYVKLLDERDCEVSVAEQDRAFNRQPIASRIAVLLAGPLLNIIFAILAYWCMFMMGVPGSKPVVGEVMPESIAASAGMLAGDQIVRVGDRSVGTWEGTVLAILDELLAEGNIALEVSREDGSGSPILLETAGFETALTEPGQLFDVLGLSPWLPVLPPVIGELVVGGTAKKAGMQAGDRVIEADGQVMDSWIGWVEFVRERPDESVRVTVLRKDIPVELDLAIGSVDSEEGVIGRIGASVDMPEDMYEDMRAYQRFGPVVALGAATAKTWEMSALTVRMVSRMLTGDVSVKNISGPINIAQYAGYSARIGFQPFLNFLAIVSISLGILNLLPIPMLDGGQVVYQLAEAVKGSPVSERAQLFGQQMGILFLLVLMSFAFYNDLARIFS